MDCLTEDCGTKMVAKLLPDDYGSGKRLQFVCPECHPKYFH